MIDTPAHNQPRRPSRCRSAAATAFVVLASIAVCRADHGPGPNDSTGSRGKMMDVTPPGDQEKVAHDHARFDRVLQKHVERDGWVDYAGLAQDSTDLDAYIVELQSAPLDALAPNDRLALLINAYNAFTLRLILDHWNDGKLKSIQDIPEGKRWDDKRWRIDGKIWSLNQIEHEQIRGKHNEPRIHFALVCAAVGCPPLRTEAYKGTRLESQLEVQTEYVHNHATWFRYDAPQNTVYLTRLYDWYGQDFHTGEGTVLDFVARYSKALRSAIEQSRKSHIEWLPYDWSLNSSANKQPR